MPDDDAGCDGDIHGVFVPTLGNFCYLPRPQKILGMAFFKSLVPSVGKYLTPAFVTVVTVQIAQQHRRVRISPKVLKITPKVLMIYDGCYCVRYIFCQTINIFNSLHPFFCALMAD